MNPNNSIWRRSFIAPFDGCLISEFRFTPAQWEPATDSNSQQDKYHVNRHTNLCLAFLDLLTLHIVMAPRLSTFLFLLIAYGLQAFAMDRTWCNLEIGEKLNNHTLLPDDPIFFRDKKRDQCLIRST